MPFGCLWWALCVVIVAVLPSPAFADPPSNSDPQNRVGRISLIDGTVSSHTVDQTEWSPAMRNYPVVSGNSFWTEPNARAEIQVGSSALRLDSSTEVDVNELDDQAMRIEVSQGSVNLHVGNLSDGITYQVLTPNEAVNILQPGTYRISAGINSEPDLVAVLKGQAQINDNVSSVTIGAGETASNPPGEMTALKVQETAPVEFDNWSLARDNYEEPRKVLQYVSPETTGYEDLESYGTWQQMPNYGAVWVPSNMAADWAPYRQGHWAWIAPWGWTWIDDAPWGFAPYHYGRWAHVNTIWFWTPGSIVHRPVYAPALVAFIGGSSWNVSVGIGSRPVGWFPLAPNEVFHPPYRVSDRYIHNVNITNIQNGSHITNTYYGGAASHPHDFANRRFATVVPAKDFATRQSMDKVALKIPPEQLAKAPHSPTAAPNVPDHRLLLNDHHLSAARDLHPRAPSALQAPLPAQAPKPEQAPTPATLDPGSLIRQMTPHSDLENRSMAPGPAIQRRAAPSTPPSAAKLQLTGTRLAPEGAPEHNNPTMIPLRAQHIEPAQPAQRHEMNVARPEQKVPLMPSHEGWVRRPPEESASGPGPHSVAPRAVPAEHPNGRPELPEGHNHPQ
jgi:hypothetical protein